MFSASATRPSSNARWSGRNLAWMDRSKVEMTIIRGNQESGRTNLTWRQLEVFYPAPPQSPRSAQLQTWIKDCSPNWLLLSLPREAVVEVGLLRKRSRPPDASGGRRSSNVKSLRPLPEQVLQHVPLAVRDCARQLVSAKRAYLAAAVASNREFWRNA